MADQPLKEHVLFFVVAACAATAAATWVVSEKAARVHHRLRRQRQPPARLHAQLLSIPTPQAEQAFAKKHEHPYLHHRGAESAESAESAEFEQRNSMTTLRASASSAPLR